MLKSYRTGLFLLACQCSQAQAVEDGFQGSLFVRASRPPFLRWHLWVGNQGSQPDSTFSLLSIPSVVVNVSNGAPGAYGWCSGAGMTRVGESWALGSCRASGAVHGLNIFCRTEMGNTAGNPVSVYTTG